jgi:hypothetical protein
VKEHATYGVEHAQAAEDRADIDAHAEFNVRHASHGQEVATIYMHTLREEQEVHVELNIGG